MGFGLGGLGKLLNKIPGVDLVNDMFEAPQYPTPPPPKVMPVAGDDEMRRKARRRAIARQQAKGGRQSTIMSNKETLG